MRARRRSRHLCPMVVTREFTNAFIFWNAPRAVFAVVDCVSCKTKVSVAVDALRREGIPFVSVLADPTYGGVSASYAMQADVRVALGSARIGFAGPAVILNTMFEMNQTKFDEACPENFQVEDAVHY